MALFDRLINEGHTVLILGDDVEMMMERIKDPGSYWCKRALDANMGVLFMRVPEVRIVSLPPMMNDRAADWEMTKSMHARNVSQTLFLGVFDDEVLVRPKRILAKEYRNAASQSPADLRGFSGEWRMREAMKLNVVELESHWETESPESICRAGAATVSIDWKKVYPDGEWARTLSYINASKDPLKIEWSLGDFVDDNDKSKRAIVLHQEPNFGRENELWIDDRSPLNLVFTIPYDLPQPWE